MKLLSLAILLLSSLPALAQFGSQAVSAGRWEPRNYTNSLGMQLLFCSYWTNGILTNSPTTVSYWTNRLANGFDLAQGTEASQPVLSRSDNKANLVIASKTFSTWTRTRMNAFGVTDTGEAGVGSFENTARTTDPLGGNTADFIQEDATAASTHAYSKAVVVAPGSYTLNCWVKAAPAPSIRTWFLLYLYTAAESFRASFDVVNGVVGTSVASGTATVLTPTIADSGNGWWLCSVRGTLAAGGSLTYYLQPAEADNDYTFSGDNTSGFFVWGASVVPSNCIQVTAPNEAGGYIATTDTPAYPGLNGKPVLVFDGSNDSMSVACAAMVQPTTVYLLHNPTTWTLNDAIFDGTSGDASGKLYQSATTPNIRFSAGTAGTELVPPSLGAWRVTSTVFDGDNSRLSTNAGPFTVSAGGAGNMAGLRLGANGTPGAWWNGQIAGVIVTGGATNSVAATTYLQHGFLKMAGVK